MAAFGRAGATKLGAKCARSSSARVRRASEPTSPDSAAGQQPRHQQVRVIGAARMPSEAPPLPAARRRRSIAFGELRRIHESYGPLESTLPATTLSEDDLPSRTAASSRAGGVGIVVSALIVVFVQRLRRYLTHRVAANENVELGDNVVGVERRSDVGNSEQPAPGDVENVGQVDLPADPAPPLQPLPESSIRLLLLATYARLPPCLSAAARPLSLARDGFFYVGGRFVRCYYCGTDVPLLDGSDSSTLERHGTLSPGCLLAGPGHPQSVTAARRVLSWALRGVRVRPTGVNRQDDMNVNWR